MLNNINYPNFRDFVKSEREKNPTIRLSTLERKYQEQYGETIKSKAEETAARYYEAAITKATINKLYELLLRQGKYMEHEVKANICKTICDYMLSRLRPDVEMMKSVMIFAVEIEDYETANKIYWCLIQLSSISLNSFIADLLFLSYKGVKDLSVSEQRELFLKSIRN